MDYYGIANKGPFIHEKVATLPAWQASDEGRQIYVEDVDKYYIGNNTGWILIGGGGSTYDITQTSHTLNVGNLVRYDNGTSKYVLAKADSIANAEVVGIVSADIDANTFTLCVNGYVTGLAGLTAGTVYFLSDSVAGALAAEPTAEGRVSKPVLIADSANSGYFFNMRGVKISSYDVKVLHFTSGSPAGDVAYTGVGFKPRFIFAMGVRDTTPVQTWGLGMSDGTSHRTLGGGVSGVAVKTFTIYLIEAGGQQGSTFGTLKTFDADGFTITWDSSGTTRAITGSFWCLR